MKVLMYNHTTSSCMLRYDYAWITPREVVKEGLIKTHWPELGEFLTQRQRVVTVVPSTSFWLSEAQLASDALFVVLDPGETLPPLSGPVNLSIPRKGVKNRKFETRKNKGEVIMSDYRVGTAVCQRSSKVVGQPAVWPTYSSRELGNYLYPGSTPYGQLPSPQMYDSSGLRRLYYASFLARYTWVELPISSLVQSPDPAAIDFTSFTVERDPELVTKVLSDCNNGVYDLLTEVLELPETFRFLSEEIKKAVFMTCDLETEARAMRKALPAEKFVKWFADHWLKGRYALLPIFYSIQDIGKVLEQIGREYAEYRGVSDLETPFPFTLPIGTKCESTPLAKHRCMIKSRYTTDSLLSDFRRLISVNLAVTAWELTTYSWVYDWAFNIGDYLSALTGSDGATESRCCYSVKNSGTYEIAYDSEDAALTGLTTLVTLNAYDRSVINPIDHIGLSSGLDMNWKRIIDAFSLSVRPAFDRLRDLRR